ncbi:MAG TPA: nitric-oxide reductase large subunit, partial [Ramlibacter sp.]|nr:nitric-oxide reductase large subunit [Ramlibacter sp.]
MKSNHGLWRWLGLIFVLSFGALGYIGWQIYLTAPPIPKAVVSTSGEVLFTGEQVQKGQQVWLASGGQQQGSVWGHGAYVAPDWSADWLHREAVALQAIRTQELRKDPAALTAADRGSIDGALKEEMRRNTYDQASGTVTVSRERAQAIREVANHYNGLFGNDASLDKLRDQYAMVEGTVAERADRQALTAFFFWTAWAAATDRPGEENLSYTSNWPHEPLVGNKMTDSAAIW